MSVHDLIEFCVDLWILVDKGYEYLCQIMQMIKEALMALNEKNGSSPYAIAKYMEEKHKSVLPTNFRKILALQLKNQAARGKLMKIKASYKLSEGSQKQKEVTTKVTTRSATEKKKQQPNRKTTTTAAKAKPSKKSETAKKVAKKVGVKKTKKTTPAKPKQPKSLRSPAKRARKAIATATA